ncbi:tyrosine-protein kinase receptor torso [Bacillus rossius redtenbacheri]|uniref:tyrosine-protein kinase receptor torso n=1 Tax=Bacillus rossius redtenbacheri TaxID=93214 RepID=UPI002FDDBEA2
MRAPASTRSCGVLLLVLQAAAAASSGLQRLLVSARCQAGCLARSQVDSRNANSLLQPSSLASHGENLCSDDSCKQCVAGANLALKYTCNSRNCGYSEWCLSSCFCVKELAETSELPSSAVAGEVGVPALLCRSFQDGDALLGVQWTGPAHALAYVVEVRQEEEASWVPQTTSVEWRTSITGLLPETRYKVRVRGLAADGQVGPAAESDWILTLADDHEPEPVTDVSVAVEEATESGVNALVSWTPASDVPCFYEVVAFPDRDYMYISNEVQYSFETRMALEFEVSYNVTVRAKDGDLRSESALAWAHFTSPSCLQALRYNLTVCRPEAVQINVTETELDEWRDGQRLYDVQVSWARPAAEPELYVVTLAVIEPREDEQRLNVTGNTTSVWLRGVALGDRYNVLVSACSTAGCSESNIVRRQSDRYYQYGRGGGVSGDDEGSGRTVTWVLVSVSLLLAAGVLAGVFLCQRRARARRDKLRIQYFQDLEKEPESEAFTDEWEIPESCLLLGAQLGEGAFGVVHRGVLRMGSNPGSWRDVAVKSLKSNAGIEDEQSFRQEMEVMRAVGQHPCIVSLVGYCTRDHRLRLVVEYCRHGDLQRFLRSAWQQMSMPRQPSLGHDSGQPSPGHDSGQPLNYVSILNGSSSGPTGSEERACLFNAVDNRLYLEDAQTPDTTEPPEERGLQPASREITATTLLAIARQIAVGMEYLSGNRVVHRDLAARNVLVCDGLSVKISDFGLSRDVYEQNVYQKKGGGRLPVKWMALESLTYQIYTAQSDVWSFGVLLWEIATLGGNPYPCTPSNQLLRLLRAGHRMECPPSCSLDLYLIMLECWKAKPKERPTFTQLSQRLDALLEASSSHKYLQLDKLSDDYHCTTPKTSSGSSQSLPPPET